MKKQSPFDLVKSINHKDYKYDLVGYVPLLTNRCFAMHIDTVMLAEQMNQFHKLSPELQYDFYYYAVRKGKRFGFPPKPEEVPNLELIQEYFGYSRQKAIEALRLLTTEDIRDIIKKTNKGGR